MKLVADLDTIKSNVEPLSTEVDTFASEVSNFSGASINCPLEEISGCLDSFKNTIGSDLDKLNTSSGEYVNLVDECCSEYQKNEDGIQAIDISSIEDIILNVADITYDYPSENAEKMFVNIEKPYFGLGNTQASEFYELGDRAYNAYKVDDPAIQEWIEKVGKIVQRTNTHGMKKSLILAQIINESGWMSTHASSLSDYNNVLGVNTYMGDITPEMQNSAWSKKQTSGYNDVTQWSSDGSHIVGTNEDMRHYSSVEECIEDYSEILSLYHPELVGNNDIYAYGGFLDHYTPNPHYRLVDKYANMIEKYNLDRFDV